MSDALDQIDLCLARGDEVEALRLLEDDSLPREEDPARSWRRDLRRACALAASRVHAVDEALLVLESLLGSRLDLRPEIPLAEWTRAHTLRVECTTRKRIRPLCEAALEDAERAEIPAHQLLLARGAIAAAFDERPAAREALEQAVRLAPESTAACAALADFLFVLGEFQRAIDLVRPLASAGAHAESPFFADDSITPAAQASGLRLIAACEGARQAYPAEVAARARVLATDAKHSSGDRISLAFACAFAGDLQRAEAELRAVHRDAPESSAGRYARKRVEHLEAAQERPAQRRRLEAFPTTRQKWNYCGPAVLELCLRYLDLELSQDEIAEVVKRERGTPMREIVAYLRAQGIEARRVACPPERIRAAIDLGLPVVVQEEYSFASHVAVITGYDEALGVFVASDPVTHLPLLKSFEWTEHSGDLFGNGGVLVVGREGAPATAELAARCDEAGLIEAEHLALLDACDERRAQLESDRGPEIATEEVLRLCDQAIGLNPDFKLAWMRRLGALHYLYDVTGLDRFAGAFLGDLHVTRVNYAFDRWPHQAHARWLASQERFAEASVEFRVAVDLDEEDAFSWRSLGHCGFMVGDFKGAEEAQLQALTWAPQEHGALIDLARVYVEQLEGELIEARDPDEWDRGWALPQPNRLPEQPIPRASGDLRARAEYCLRTALAATPGDPHLHSLRGVLAQVTGEEEAAAEAFSRAVELGGALYEHEALARLSLTLGRPERTETACEHLVETYPGAPRVWLLFAQFRRAQARWTEAVELLERGVVSCARAEERDQLVAPLFEALSEQLGSSEAAAGRLRELAEERWGDWGLIREVALVLDDEGQRGHAIGLYRYVLDLAPGDIGTRYRLGCLLCGDVLTAAEGRELLEQTVALSPESAPARVRLAWQYLKDDPARGLELLEPVLVEQDASAYETAAALARELGETERAAELRRLALAGHRSVAEGQFSLCRYHLFHRRYDLALELARSMSPDAAEEQEREDVEATRLTAYRLAGAGEELLEWARERCTEEVPEHLAWEIYYSFDGLDHELSARAALRRSEVPGEEERLSWRVRAAENLAQAGDTRLLDGIEAELGQDADAWAALSFCYDVLDRFADADRAARVAAECDPRAIHVLSALEEAALRRGDLDGAFAVAQSTLEFHPYEHVGDERLGLLCAKTGRFEEGLAHSLRAVDIAPFCHIAQQSRAVALLMAGELEEAVRHATRSVQLRRSPHADEASDGLMIQRALQGDLAGLQRCLARWQLKHPETLFAEYRAHLLALARARGGAAGGSGQSPPR